MFHGILDDRLEDERRNANRRQAGRHFDLDPQPLLEARALDVEIGLDDFELASERGEFSFRSQHGPQQRGEPHQRVERARRRGLDQVADRGQRVEQEMRIDLRAQRPELRFGRELADLLLADLALVALVGDADAVDAPGGDHGDRLEGREIIGKEPPSARDFRNRNRVSRGLAGRHEDKRFLPARDHRGRRLAGARSSHSRHVTRFALSAGPSSSQTSFSSDGTASCAWTRRAALVLIDR